MHRFLVATAVLALPDAAHAYGGDNDIATIGFTDGRLHVEWVWDGAPAEVIERVKTWKQTSTPDVHRGKQITCSVADDYLVCAVEIDHKGKVHAPRYLLAYGDVTHPVDPIRGQTASSDDGKRTRTVIGETPGVLIWAWIDGAKDDADSRVSAHLHCRTENAMAGQFGAECGLSFDARGRVRAADPL